MSASTVGYLCCLVSVLGFGSNYIPVKRVDVKDGIFFTLCMSVGICMMGFIQWALFGFYKFEPFAMLGGAIWAVGNACVPFIIKSCGLGAGQLVWSVTNMSTGWATGTFGLFGKEKDSVQYLGLNCFGVALTILSLAPFAMMRDGAKERSDTIRQIDGLLEESPATPVREPPNTSSINFTAGFVLALFAGIFMGSNFDPPTYLQQLGPPEHSKDAMDYVISHFAGIFVASLLYFCLYVVAKREEVFCGKEVVIPGIIAGMMWGIAQIAWFKANGVLSYVVAFPIIVSVPGALASVWGVLLFGENRGRRNLALLSCVIVLQILGVTIVAKSKGNA